MLGTAANLRVIEHDMTVGGYKAEIPAFYLPYFHGLKAKRKGLRFTIRAPFQPVPFCVHEAGAREIRMNPKALLLNFYLLAGKIPCIGFYVKA